MNKSTYKHVKKVIMIVLLAATLLSLSACSDSPKNFTFEELTVTLTSEYKESSKKDFDMYISSDDVIFSAVKQTTSELDAAGYEIFSLNDFCLEICERNKVASSRLVGRNNYYYFTNSNTVSGAKYTYVHCMFQNKDDYWICEFVCKTKNYERLKSDIMSWADSITFN